MAAESVNKAGAFFSTFFNRSFKVTDPAFDCAKENSPEIAKQIRIRTVLIFDILIKKIGRKLSSQI
jgi:hypothetical protein